MRFFNAPTVLSALCSITIVSGLSVYCKSGRRYSQGAFCQSKPTLLIDMSLLTHPLGKKWKTGHSGPPKRAANVRLDHGGAKIRGQFKFMTYARPRAWLHQFPQYSNGERKSPPVRRKLVEPSGIE